VRRLLAAAALALAAPAAAAGAVQQVLLPGPTPYPTPSPPLVTVGPPPWANLPFRIHARSEQRVLAGVDGRGHLVSLRVLQRLLLTGVGDYQFVVSAPVEDVRPGPGSQSQPGLRRGQILWSGFASKRKLLSADAVLRPKPAEPFLPLRLEGDTESRGYTLRLENTTVTSQAAYTGAGFRNELARLLDRTRLESLAGSRLSTAYVELRGLVRATRRTTVAAPLHVEGTLRFPERPKSVVGGTIRGSTVTFSTVLGDERPLNYRLDVRGGGGAPRLHLVARPTAVVRMLVPPGASSWVEAVRRRPLPAKALLQRVLEARMQLVRSDQYQAFLNNPDVAGRNRTVYVYKTAAASPGAATAPSRPRSGDGSGWLMVLLAAGGTVVAAGAALVGWAHS